MTGCWTAATHALHRRGAAYRHRCDANAEQLAERHRWIATSTFTAAKTEIADGTRPGHPLRAVRWCTGLRYVSTAASSPAGRGALGAHRAIRRPDDHLGDTLAATFMG